MILCHSEASLIHNSQDSLFLPIALNDRLIGFQPNFVSHFMSSNLWIVMDLYLDELLRHWSGLSYYRCGYIYLSHVFCL